ncbi:MAG: YfhO family protein [Nanoarchaeota archaeon]
MEKWILGFQAASAHRALVLSNLAVALLAGFGVEYFLQSKQLRIKWAFLVPGITVVGFTTYAIIFFFLSQSNPDIYHPLVRGIPQYIVALRNSVIPLFIFFVSFIIVWFFRRQKTKAFRKTGVVILCTVLLFEVFRFGWKFTSFSPRHIVFPTTPVLEFLIEKEKPVRITGSQVIPINMRMAYGLESLEGYDAAYPLNISKFIAAINSESVATNPAGRYGIVDNVTSPLLELSNTVYYLTIKRGEENKPSAAGRVSPRFDPERFRVVFEDKSVAVLESKNALPRAFMVFDWEEINDDTLLLESLLNKNFSIREKILLSENPGIQRGDGKEVKNSVRYKKYREQESKLIVTTESSGMLFVSETFYPGWKAYVDGKEEKLLKANFAFRAIPILKGEHTVQFIYKPESFFLGLKISAFSLLVILLFLLFRKNRLMKMGKLWIR